MRSYLDIAVALMTFTAGFIAADSYENLAIALPVALVVFVVLKKLARANLQHIQVALITLLIWIPFAAFTLNVFAPRQSCVVEFSEEEIKSSKDEEHRNPERFAAEHSKNEIDGLKMNSVWGGVIDKKAIFKPDALYPSLMKTAGVQGVVAVSIVVDPTGKVIGAQAVSGHPLLRESAEDAARQARFEPTKVCGIPPNVSGILTYHFGL
jgi:TonB family protein